MKPKDAAREILYLALSEPIGILVSTNDFERGRQMLYTTRAGLKDPALAVLQFRVSPWPEQGQIVICKEKVRVEEEAFGAEELGL